MTLPSTSDLTCVIPTHNRPHFLRRLLTYWSAYPLNANVLIADSSEPSAAKENQRLVEQFATQLRLRYEHIDQEVILKCYSAVQLVETAHVVFCADDDFLIPDAVDRSYRWLKQNSGYVCAQGIMASVVSFRGNRCDLIRGYEMAAESAAKRFRQMAKFWYSTFYAVYTTDALSECYRVATEGPAFCDARIYFELTISQMTALQGKVGFLPEVYSIRQEHQRNDNRAMTRVQDLAHGEKHYRHFRRLLVQQLQRYAGAAESKAIAMVDAYYDPLIQGKVVHSGLPKIRREIMRIVRKFVGHFQHDRILERHRLPPKHPIWKDVAWRLAYRLILDYPEGMTDQELTTERRLTDQRRARAA